MILVSQLPTVETLQVDARKKLTVKIGEGKGGGSRKIEEFFCYGLPFFCHRARDLFLTLGGGISFPSPPPPVPMCSCCTFLQLADCMCATNGTLYKHWHSWRVAFYSCCLFLTVCRWNVCDEWHFLFVQMTFLYFFGEGGVYSPTSLFAN